MNERITEREIVDNNSPVDSMRWGFVRMIRLGIALAIVTVGMIVASPWLPIPATQKPWDIASMITLDGIVFGAAFGGHVGQSFSPDSRPNMNITPMAPAPLPPQNKVSEE